MADDATPTEPEPPGDGDGSRAASILLFGGDEMLAKDVERSGRRIRLHGLDDAAAEFSRSAAMLALVDARPLASAIETLWALSQLVDARGAAMIAVVPPDDAAAPETVIALGATHFVAGPRDLVATLGSAERYVRRLRTRAGMGAISAAQSVRGGGPMWEWRPGDPHVQISPALAALLGEASGAVRLPLARALGLIAEADRDGITRALARLRHEGGSLDLFATMVVDGRERTIAHHVRAHRAADGRLARLTATVEDVDSALFDRRLSVHFDLLTGLANAAFARDWLDQMLSGGSEYDPACLLLLLALTRFDGINVAYGRRVADGLLQAVARRLRRIAGADRPGSRVLARMAGAEFAVAFAGPVRLSDATVLARRMGAAFERPFLVDGHLIHLACRVGIAVGGADTPGADTLLLRATAALSRAKEGEPNGFEVYAHGDSGDLSARTASLGDDLRAAIEADGLALLYQPQVTIDGERIVGVEALVRWHHPTIGLLPPETLMAIAERAEIGPKLGRYILGKALSEAVAWPHVLGGLRLAINVTADDLAAPDFAERVLQTVEATGFAAGRLTIELTESGLMRDVRHAARTLERLRKHGIHVAIDDFGTGYSSLSYLSALPIDYLKVDKSLVTDLFGSARDRVIVRGVVDIARSLDLIVIAEGVETEEQREAAARAGCQFYQGYLCARPLGTPALAGLVQAWNVDQVAS